MKSPKAKVTKKEVKKKAKAKIEVDLTKKIKDFVKSLGHDAEEIGDEIKKASKILSKKLVVKIKDAKKSLDAKIKSATTSKKEKVKREVKKDLVKTKEVINATIKKEVKPVVKAVTKTVKATAAKVEVVDIGAVKTPVKRVRKLAAPKAKPEGAASGKEANSGQSPKSPTASAKRTRAKPISKSDAKSENTDLPLNTGPKNKHKRS